MDTKDVIPMIIKESERTKRKVKIKPHFWLILVLLIMNIVCLISFLSEAEVSTTTPEDILEPTIFIPEPTITPLLEEDIIPRYGFTEDDIYLLAQLLCGGKDYDGDGEYDIDFEKNINYYEVGKVLSVVMNRVRSDVYPDTVYEVVTQEGQFSPMPKNLTKEPSDIALRTVREWCEAYDNYINLVQVVPESHLYFRGDSFTNTTREKFHD